MVSPRWLDVMLWQWGLWSLRRASGALGYPTVCPMLKEGIPSRAEAFEPTGYSGEDYRQLEAAIAGLDQKHQLAIVRAYRPWKIAAIAEELIAKDVSDRTWQRWVHEAAALVAEQMGRQAA